jgi:serine protease Do
MPYCPAGMKLFSCRPLWIGVVCACCLLSGSPASSSELRESPIVKAVRTNRAAIVSLCGEKTVATSTSSTVGDSSRRVNGMGTGVVVDPRGYIITNFHVVDGVREIQATLANDQKYVARLIARDLETDLALIKIDPREKLQVITVGTSSDLMPGESVIAVGNAYGYPHTVTRGIISALHRAVQVSDAQAYDDLIQTDASINPGNSGGPLLNIDGEMIGVNVAVRAGAQGIGFAIPVDKVMAVATELIAAVNHKRLSHGVNLVRNKTSDKQVKVGVIDPDSPAAEAGMEVGDVIKSVDDLALSRALDFQRALLDKKAGDQMKITVVRNGEEVALDLTLTNASREAKVDAQPAWEVLGLELRVIPAEDFKSRYQTEYRGGLVVVSVRPGSPAAAQGIRRGDVLVGMHVWETVSLANVSYILGRPDFSTISPVKFFILRGNDTLYGYMPVAMKKSTVTQ